MKVPWAQPLLQETEKEYVAAAVKSTWISGGPYLERFEKEFSDICDSSPGLAVSSGTAAIHLALIALGISNGDEVIVPAFSFAAAANMVLALGARPVPADIDPDTFCISAEYAESKISRNTKAVVAVHSYGNMCEMSEFKQLCSEKGLVLIEDSAEALFSRYKGQYSGTLGDIGCFSFQAAKTITTGEGGFILARDRTLVEKMRIIRSHGMSPLRHYWHETIGYNFRLTNMQAALGCAQLLKKEEIISSRKQIYGRYKARLGEEAGIKLQKISAGTVPVMWTMPVMCDLDSFKCSRDDIIATLGKRAIECRPGFYPLSSMPVYEAEVMKNASLAAESIICLPLFAGMTVRQCDYVCDNLLELRK